MTMSDGSRPSSRIRRVKGGGHVHTIVIEPRRSREDAHRADDGETGRHQGTMMAKPAGIRARYSAKRERPVTTRCRNIPSVRSTDPPSSQRGGDDEAEDVEHAGAKTRVDVVAAGRPVGLRRECVGEQPYEKEDGGMPMFTRIRAIMSRAVCAAP